LCDYKNSHIFVIKIVITAQDAGYKSHGKASFSLPPSAFRQKTFIMQLTKAEEQIMQILWEMEEGIVKDIRDNFSDPKPARNTVSTVLRVLERKGYVSHKAFGNVHLYHPLISKKAYSKSQLFGLMEDYFNNSFPAMASFFAKEKDLTVKELDDLLKDTKKELKKSKKRD
jgi:predicted transcriptional regulator